MYLVDATMMPASSLLSPPALDGGSNASSVFVFCFLNVVLVFIRLFATAIFENRGNELAVSLKYLVVGISLRAPSQNKKLVLPM
jgi:hypothetical protein